ncbi:hypothetical protein DB30_03241 [Enhygromyxa salina]|uniref:Uncharacterized protein n=1 Tax=Enhygromyxa salina TaxID=215803 RepID=A0A0C2D7C2_9BACT|nr:hypothetical protein DB30_03241 [Enhygromyxa salina]
MLIGARPVAGTTFDSTRRPEGWPNWVRKEREDGQLLEAAGKTLEVSLRGSRGETLQLRAPWPSADLPRAPLGAWRRGRAS